MSHHLCYVSLHFFITFLNLDWRKIVIVCYLLFTYHLLLLLVIYYLLIIYFWCPPSDLTLGVSALCVSGPQSPAAFHLPLYLRKKQKYF